MGDVVKLVENAISTKSVDMLKLAIKALERDGALGAAVIYIYPGGHFVLDLDGVARDDPMRLRGILNKFDDELAKLPTNARK